MLPLADLLGLYELSILPHLLLLPLLWLVIKWRRAPSPESQPVPPSPPKIPIIGNLHQLGTFPHRSLAALSKKYGSLMLLHLGQVPTLVVTSADAACEIMKTHDLVFASRPSSMAVKILLAGSWDLAFAPYGEHWRQTRKLCMFHLLSTKMVESFRGAREEEVDRMIEKISSRVSSHMGAVDVSEVMNCFTHDVLCRVVSGKFVRGGVGNHIFRELVKDSQALIAEFNVGDFIPYLAWMDVFFGLGARVKRTADKWEEVLDRIIKQHADRSGGRGNEETDFVDVLLEYQRQPNKDFDLNEGHIKAILKDMFFAGIDTSFIALEWAMAELVRSPEAMKKLQDEVRGIAGGRAKIKEEDLTEMSYLKAVVKESLRLHPPVSLLLPRQSMQDCQIGVYKVHKETRVFINAWAINRDPRFWEAPEEFWPERFIGSSVDFKGNDFKFVPFGAGRRICPGMKLAVSTVELGLANLIHQFDWELPAGMKRENMNMDDEPGLAIYKKHKLHLVAKPYRN